METTKWFHFGLFMSTSLNPGLGEVYNPDLKVKSGWLPPADRNVDNFMADLTRKLEKMVQEDNENFCNGGAKHFKNLSNQQLKALKKLQHNQASEIEIETRQGILSLLTQLGHLT